jgi:hypothetical protein
MKSKLLASVCLLLIELCCAQSVLVPYRTGKKFGLSDEKRKIVVKPAYDKIEYLGGTFFQYTNESGANLPGKTTTYGVFNKSKLIIKDQHFRYFLVYANCIIGSQNRYRGEHATLFNLKGEAVTKGESKGIYVNDQRDVGYLGDVTHKFSLISIFDVQGYERLFSLAVFDNQKQQITQWLLRNVKKYKLSDFNQTVNAISCTYEDENGKQEKRLSFSDGKFILTAESDFHPVNGSGTGGDDYVEIIKGDVSDELSFQLEDNNDAVLSDDELEKKGLLYYMHAKDSLYYYRGNVSKTIKAPANTKFFSLYGAMSKQTQHIIYKQKKKYGLVVKGELAPASYDSLVYFGKGYIAGRQINGAMRYGILDLNGNEAVAMVYDSIFGELKDVKFITDETTKKRQFRLAEKDRRFTNAYIVRRESTTLIYQNGKAGLIVPNNEIIIKPEFDFIAKNEIFAPENTKVDFLILKKDGKYGVTSLVYDTGKQHYVPVGTVEPAFSGIPGFYYSDYYEKSGFRLFGIYDTNYNLLGFAAENGTMYYTD